MSRSNDGKTSVLPARWGTVKEGPKCYHSQTPTTPPMWDTVGKNRIRVRTVVAQGQGWIASQNLIGHIAKVGRGRRVAGGVKARSAVRVGGQRVASVMEAGSEINMNPVDQEFGLSQHEREMPDQSPSRTAQKDMRDAGHSAFSNDLSKFRKLKDEVM